MSLIPFDPTPSYPFTIHPSAKSHTIWPTGGPGGLTLRAQPKSDWWHTPEPDPADRRTGALYAIPIDGTRDFEFGVWMRGEWGSQYDQGCVMVLCAEGEELGGDWVKAGVEKDNGKEWIGAVVASPWSDWSIWLAPHSSSILSHDPYTLYMHINRTGATLTIRYKFAQTQDAFGIPKLEELTMMREVKAFNVDAEGKSKTPSGGKWRVGVMTCGPTNEEGTLAEFRDFTFKYL